MRLKHLFESNRAWAESIKAEYPDFFSKLSGQQSPKYLWIGCADSRVPANEIVGLLPGELFVHRNVANVVIQTDLNCLSVIQYAVDVLKVEHIIVCGHYGCGGVRAAMDSKSYGLIDNWLHSVKINYQMNRAKLDRYESDVDKLDVMCELNVLEQVANTSFTTIVQNAWARGQDLDIHGWIYNINDGILRDLGFCISSLDQVPEEYRLVNPSV